MILESLADEKLLQDFHRRVVNIAAAGKRTPSTYASDIFWAPGGDILARDILTPAKWIQLLSSEKIEEDTFFLSRKHSSSGTIDGDPDNYEERNKSGRFGIWEETPRIPRDHHTRYKRRDTGSLSRPSTELFMSDSVNSRTTRSRFDQDSAYGQRDQSSAEDRFPENERPKISGYPVELTREWQESCSVVENKSSQSPNESGLDLKRSERTEDEQSTREASPGIFKLIITPGSLIPLFLNGRWFGIVPYNPQRLLTWSNDRVSTDEPVLDELQDRRSDVADDDMILGSGKGQDQTQTQSAPIHPENSETLDRLHPERNTSDEDRSRGFQEASPKSSGLITFPFFTWHVKHGTEEYSGLPAIQESDETVVRILAKIHESITSDKSSYKTLYEKAYRCTADDLFLRHPDIEFRVRTTEDSEDDEDTARDPRRVCRRKEVQSARGSQETTERNCPDVRIPNERPESDPHGLQGGKVKQAKDSASAEREQPALSSSDEMAIPIRPGEGSSKFEMNSDANHKSWSQDSVEAPNQALQLKTQLLEVSQSIFRAFLPSQSAYSYSDYYHPLCERFWGSLDEIFRVSLAYMKESIIFY